MAVRRYRTVEEMPGDRPLRPLDPVNLRIFFELSELARALRPWRLAPGVRKFRSAAELDRAREERDLALAREPRVEQESS